MLTTIKNIIKYYIAKLPGQLFVENNTGAIYESGRYLGAVSIFLGPSLTTRSEEGLSPGIGMSSLMVDQYKDLENFIYVGKV